MADMMEQLMDEIDGGIAVEGRALFVRPRRGVQLLYGLNVSGEGYRVPAVM